MWRDMLVFCPLAVLTNTALPLCFDPVLIYFASRHAWGPACAFALIGSVCAGVAALVDVKVLGSVRALDSLAWLPAPPAGRGGPFYALTFCVAASPLPFSIIRFALLRRRPDAVLYGMAVGFGRLPRYVLTVYCWRSLALPGWASTALLVSAAAFALYTWRRSRRRSPSAGVVPGASRHADSAREC